VIKSFLTFFAIVGAALAAIIAAKAAPTIVKLPAQKRARLPETLILAGARKDLFRPVIKKSTPNISPIFKSLPRTKLSFLKNAKKGLVDAVFVFVKHPHFRDNANGLNQTCHIGCPLSVASVQHH